MVGPWKNGLSKACFCSRAQAISLRGSEPLAAMAKGLGSEAEGFARDAVTASLVRGHRQETLRTMPERIEFAARGFDFQAG